MQGFQKILHHSLLQPGIDHGFGSQTVQAGDRQIVPKGKLGEYAVFVKVHISESQADQCLSPDFHMDPLPVQEHNSGFYSGISLKQTPNVCAQCILFIRKTNHLSLIQIKGQPLKAFAMNLTHRHQYFLLLSHFFPFDCPRKIIIS